MSTTTPGAKDPASPAPGTPTPGSPLDHHEAPNPIELWFETNRRNLLIGVIVVVVAIVAYQGTREISKQENSATWSEFVTTTGLDGPYGPDPILPFEDINFAAAFQYSGLSGPASRIHEYVARAELDDIRALLDAGGDDERVPMLLWAAANVAYERGDFAVAKEFANRLKDGFPNHPFCVESEHPVQPPMEVVDYDKERDPKDEPEYEEPRQGSLVGFFLQTIEEEQAYRAANPELYTPEALPEGAPRVELTFTIDGTPVGEDGKVVIGLFTKHAPKHCEAFLQRVRDGWFADTFVDLVARGNPGSLYSDELRIGNQLTKEGADKTKWITDLEDDETPIEWEKGVSHWPGTLAADRYFESENGRNTFYSSDEMFLINTIEAAHTWDDERVAFGRVISGLDILKEIVQEEILEDDSEEGSSFGPRMGFGPPLSSIGVSVKIIE